MEYTLANNLEGLLLYVDFEKAFDSIEWQFIWKALRRYNFGNYLINEIKLLYNNPESCIMINAWNQ